jgi:hypothetical protein
MALTPDTIPAVYKSIIRATVDMIEDLNQLSVVAPPIQYHNWEERGLEKNLPSTTLIGTDGFSFDENNGLWIVRYALAISSYRDANLLNEIELVGHISARFAEGAKVPLREMSAGEEVSELLVAEFKLFPMSQSELRNYRTIGIELARTGK